MESFFALLQKNVLNSRRWATRQELRLTIVSWIERTYHRRRRQRVLGRLTPVEFEAIMTTLAASAAYEEESPEPSAVPGHDIRQTRPSDVISEWSPMVFVGPLHSVLFVSPCPGMRWQASRRHSNLDIAARIAFESFRDL